MNRILQDVRYATRQLRKSPGFALTAILTLALGIGANVAVFSVMNAVLLNPSGIPNPGQVVALRARYRVGDMASISMSAPDFGDATSSSTPLAAAAAMQPGNFNYQVNNALPVRLIGANVTSQWFDVFRAQPLMGRVFRPEEDLPEANHEIVLSYASWKSRFGGNPHIVGQKINLNGLSYEVIGVMKPDFALPNQAELWSPLGLDPNKFKDPNYRYNENLFAVGRMKEGVTLQQVNAFLDHKAEENVATEGSGSYGRTSGWGMFAIPLVDFVAGNLRQPLNILLASVLLVLLIACANIAGLQLARASARQREASIQIALGASRGSLIQHALVESLLLSAAGVVLGLGIAKVTIPAILLLAPSGVAQNINVHVGGVVLLFAIVAGVLCALLCGTAPAWHMTRMRWFQALQEAGRSETSSRNRQRMRSALVVGEIAMAMLLLVGAGLLIRSLEHVARVETGFDGQGLMTGVLSLPQKRYSTNESQGTFYTQFENELRANPEVQDVAISDSLPFDNLGGSASFEIAGHVTGPSYVPPHGYIRSISPAYFSTLRVPLLRGRTFTSEDREKTQQVAIIDDVLARQYWPNQDPVGSQIYFDTKGPRIVIIGVVRHTRFSSLDADGMEGFYFLPLSQSPSPTFSVAVRTRNTNPVAMSEVLQAAARNVDSSQPVYDLKTMDERINDSLLGRRFLVALLSIFAGLALLLSALGLYGVITYGVKLRIRELGIRMALGAQRTDVLRLILGQGLKLALIGLVLGVFCVVIAGRTLSSMLYQVSLFNPLTLAVTSLLLSATVLVASYLPAQRASRLDPMQTLRDE